MKLANNLDFAKLQALNLRLQNLGGAPSSPVEGQVYYDTGTKEAYVYTNLGWLLIGHGVVTAVNATAPITTSGGAAPTIGITAATSGAAGSMSAADKSKLDGITAGATANASDSYLLNRANHTGSDAISNVTGLQTALDNKLDDAQLGAASGVASLDASTKVPVAQIPAITSAMITDGTIATTDLAAGVTLATINAPGSAVSLNSQKIINLATPTAATDAATMGYVDSVAQGLDAKPSARVATTANITLSGTQTIDGVAVVVGDRVLVKDQTTPAQNGIYVVAAGAWSRAADMDVAAEFPAAYVWVEEGTAQQDSGWVVTTNAPVTVGTTSITWTQFSGAGQITAGSGLTKSGNTIDIGVPAFSGLALAADTIAVDFVNPVATNTYIPRKYATNVGDGSSTSFVITHSLNTRDVQVTTYLNSGTYEEVIPDVEHTSTTTVTLRFGVAPTANQYRVVVTG